MTITDLQSVLIYALLAPLILPLSFISFGIMLASFRHRMLYTAYIPFDNGGIHYFYAVFNLFWGIITAEICYLGLFVLKIDSAHYAHDAGQIALITLALFLTLQYRAFLQGLYNPLMRNLGVGMCGLSSSDRTFYDQGLRLPQVREKYRTSPRGLHSRSNNSEVDSVIWLPRDSIGVSDTMLETVKRKYFSSGVSGRQRISNASAEMSMSGHVVLQEDITSTIDNFGQSC